MGYVIPASCLQWSVYLLAASNGTGTGVVAGAGAGPFTVYGQTKNGFSKRVLHRVAASPKACSLCKTPEIPVVVNQPKGVKMQSFNSFGLSNRPCAFAALRLVVSGWGQSESARMAGTTCKAGNGDF